VYCLDASQSTRSQSGKTRLLKVAGYLQNAEGTRPATLMLVLDNLKPETFLKNKANIAIWNGGPEIFTYYYKVINLKLKGKI